MRIECILDGRSTDILFAHTDAKGRTDYATRVGQLPIYFAALAELMRSADKGVWTRCVFDLDNAGRHHADFAY